MSATAAGDFSTTLADPSVDARWRQLETILALGCLFLIGVRMNLPVQVPLGFVILLCTLPLWLRVARQSRQATALLVLLLLALVSGAVLTLYAPLDHQVRRGAFIGEFTLITLTFGGAYLIFWSAELAGEKLTGFVFGGGLMVGAALHGYSSTLNAWKGAWGVPVAVALLALCGRRKGLTVVVLLVLGLVSVLFDTRSYFAVFVIAALIIMWSMIPTAPRAHRSWLGFAWVLLALSAATYLVGTQLLVSGYLGAEAQQRSIQQIDESGTLILGGRPEAAATAALMAARPFGFGFGVLPSSGDVQTAKEGMMAINYDPNNGYVDTYMFGSGFELHSVTGDIWVRTGLVGIALIVAVVAVLVRHLALSLGNRRLSGLSVFASLWTFWNLLFSPLLSSYLPLMLAVGLALHSEHVAARDHQAGRASPHGRPQAARSGQDLPPAPA